MRGWSVTLDVWQHGKLHLANQPRHHTGSTEFNRISFTQRELSAPQTAWVTLPKMHEGGWAGTRFLPKKTWGKLGAFAPPPKPPHNRTPGMSVLTVPQGRGYMVSTMSDWYLLICVHAGNLKKTIISAFIYLTQYIYMIIIIPQCLFYVFNIEYFAFPYYGCKSCKNFSKWISFIFFQRRAGYYSMLFDTFIFLNYDWQ